MSTELDFSALQTSTSDSTEPVSNDDTDAEVVTTIDKRGFEELNTALPHADAVYRDSESGRSADEVDPRLLFKNPDTNEIRWYARFNGVAKTILKKPIRDAFKNGFSLVPSDRNDDIDPTDDDSFEGDGSLSKIVTEWVYNYYIEAEIKARRDGPSAIFYKTVDGADVHEPPSNVSELVGMEVMTLDKWTGGGSPKGQIMEVVDEDDPMNVEIRPSGIVIRRNIGHPNHRELLGYVYQENDSPHSAQFIHADRCDHFAWNTENDGNVDDFTVAEHEGDSVLLPIFIPLKSLMTANWAMGQTVFRYSAPLYAVETPDNYGQDEFDTVSEQVEGLNSASDIVLPPGCEISTEGNHGNLDPEPYIDKLIEQCCSGTEFTKSVLLGTQTGTVSGSSTDIKNYFNQVQRYRTGRAQANIMAFIDRLNEWGLTDISSDELEVDWGPLFRLDELDRMEAVVRLVTAGSNAINNYILTPEEARELMAMEWAELDIDMDLEELDDDDFAMIAEIVGGDLGSEQAVEEPEGNPAVGQNGGGMEQGQETDPANPT